jgi:hypothetical protein
MGIEGWPFLSIRNKLLVHIKSASTANDSCGSGSVGVDGSDNLRWMQLTMNGVTLYPPGWRRRKFGNIAI